MDDTFIYSHIRVNRWCILTKNLDVSELMAYKINKYHLKILSKALMDPKFKKNCRKYILDQGIINDTIFIIAKTLGINEECRNVNFQNI